MFRLEGGILKRFFFLLVVSFLVFSVLTMGVAAWSNGGYSDDPSNPDYGTHDWIAEHALDWLPSDEKEYIENNLTLYLYGTELPDNYQAEDGIGDAFNHHLYYFSDGTLQGSPIAVRASAEYDLALNYLRENDFENATKHAGIMAHYITDVAVFGHVMGSYTDWGAEEHHSGYENYVNSRTNNYTSDFVSYLSFDGSLDTITAYNATLELASDTTFDEDGELTCVWMDQNYNWSNPTFMDRCGESLNLAVNYLTDVLHTLYVSRITKIPSSITCNVSSTSFIVGENVTISGEINASESTEVTIKVSTDEGETWDTLTTMTTGSEGNYSHTWTPTSAGSYQLKASWPGNEMYTEAVSGAVAVTVEEAGSNITWIVGIGVIGGIAVIILLSRFIKRV